MNVFKPVLISALLGAFSVLHSASSLAHFQMLQVDQYLRDKGGAITLGMPFTHPATGGPMMQMARPQAFSVTHKGKTQDLTERLSEVSWRGVDNEATAWIAETKLRGLGDYVFALQPEPYFEASENLYIQQFTKTVVNVGGLPTDWDQPLDIAAEIVPDQAPYAVYAGGLFSGVVMADGQPVPKAQIEVEYLNHPIEGQSFISKANVHYPSEHLHILTIRADERGRFYFTMPHAGYWGFAALGVGNKREHKGKELSQDAVLWIQAHQLSKQP